MAKYNQLLRIEEELGELAVFPGKTLDLLNNINPKTLSWIELKNNFATRFHR